MSRAALICVNQPNKGHTMKILFLVAVVVLFAFFFWRGDQVGRAAADTQDDCVDYISDLKKYSIVCYGTSFVCAMAAIACIVDIFK